MDHNYNKAREEYRLKIAEARQQLVTQYCDFIKNQYVLVSDIKKETVANRLEVIIQYMESPSETNNLIEPILAREQRVILGLTQEKLAEQIGVSRQFIANYENGIVKTDRGRGTKKYLVWIRERIGDKK